MSPKDELAQEPLRIRHVHQIEIEMSQLTIHLLWVDCHLFFIPSDQAEQRAGDMGYYKRIQL